MTLDSQFAELISTAIAAGGPPISTLPVEEARKTYRERYLMRGAKSVQIDRVDDLEIEGPAGPIKSRLYDPDSSASEPKALLIYFHGGGFVVGDIEAYDPQCRLIAKRTGCVILAPDYRLAPEHPFPAAADDAIAIVNYVLENAASFGVDSARIAVGGDSAGGNLAAVVAQHYRRLDPPLCCQLLLYPSLDKTVFVNGGATYESVDKFSHGYFLDRSTMEWFSKHQFPESDAAWDYRASPILRPDLTGICPAYIVTPGFDPLRDIGRSYADKLKKAGVPVVYRCFDTLIHNFFGYIQVIDAARSAFDEVMATFRDQMAAKVRVTLAS